jgi:hypothetical protein
MVAHRSFYLEMVRIMGKIRTGVVLVTAGLSLSVSGCASLSNSGSSPSHTTSSSSSHAASSGSAASSTKPSGSADSSGGPTCIVTLSGFSDYAKVLVTVIKMPSGFTIADVLGNQTRSITLPNVKKIGTGKTYVGVEYVLSTTGDSSNAPIVAIANKAGDYELQFIEEDNEGVG